MLTGYVEYADRHPLLTYVQTQRLFDVHQPARLLSRKRKHLMENTADSGPATTVPARFVVSEDVGTHLGTNQTLDFHHGSVSSPDLNKPPPAAADASVSRTRTLPLRSTRRISTGVPTLQGVTFDDENLEHLRRWVLGLAIGNCSLVQPCTIYAYSLISVDFDLEQGPSLTCIFPLFPLYPFEAENMFVLHSSVRVG